MNEVWKDIKGYEGLYQISNLGNVRSLGFSICSRHNKITHREGKILKPILKSTGYYAFNLCGKNGRKMHDMHRLIATHFIPNPENKREINHINCIKTDNSLSNLEWVTRKENATHAYKNNLFGIKPYFGEENPRTKLTSEKVLQIKRMIKSGERQADIARLFKVDETTIRAIRQNKTWKRIIYTK
jgi:hypothetical protein